MNKVFVIAEAGVNHNGSLSLAHQLIDNAARSGADAIKFQTFKAKSLVTYDAPKAKYQMKTTASNENQLAMISSLELKEEDHRELLQHCENASIKFLSSPFDISSVRFLHELGLNIFKIPSGEITNLPYLRKIGSYGCKVFLSTGMCVLGDIEAALEVLEQAGTSRGNITLLHCTTEYPAPVDEVNLNAINTLRFAFPGIAGVGYSDHTKGIHIPIAATAIGARVIEKHFTLDRNMEGPDHKASLEPDELKEMINAIRDIEKALGDGIKRPSLSEKSNILIARKSLVAAREIKKGEVFSEENVMAKRPGNGISPMRWDEILGQHAPRDYQKDELL
ncbi:MAG: N-acetylneuraminate synthase [Bacteroidales bacterium]|nr:N-acetylneuraminate synthase [Bacteroidales bacterium]